MKKIVWIVAGIVVVGGTVLLFSRDRTQNSQEGSLEQGAANQEQGSVLQASRTAKPEGVLAPTAEDSDVLSPSKRRRRRFYKKRAF